MAVVAGVLSERQKRTLEALCDTWVPAVDPDGSDPVEASFLARPATEIGVADQIEGLMADAMTPDEIAATAELLDALADRGLRDPIPSPRGPTWWTRPPPRASTHVTACTR